MIQTSDGSKAGSLTDNGDGTITMRLLNGSVTLREPSARDYAELRTKIVDVDRALQDRFRQPLDAPPVDDVEHMTPEELVALTEFQTRILAWTRQRNDFLNTIPTGENPDAAPYGQCVIEVVRRLGGREVTWDDLTREALSVVACKALLETWEAPLGGRAAPVEIPAVPQPSPAESEAVAPSSESVPSAPDSPAPEQSSPPGIDNFPPSPQPSSTP